MTARSVLVECEGQGLVNEEVLPEDDYESDDEHESDHECEHEYEQDDEHERIENTI